jgi:sugar-specific transcriptional regulator TrmB
MEGITKKLTNFGFTQDEARFYLFLSIMGPSPIRALVRRFDINRIKVYRTLKRLEERGLVERVMSRPVQYNAKSIEDSLQTELDAHQREHADLEKSRNEILEDWDKLALTIEDQPVEPRFRIHQGRQQIYNQIEQMCDKGVHDITIVTTERDLHRLALYGFDEKLRSLAKNNIQIRILTQVESVGFEEIADYFNFSAIRHVSLPSAVRFLVVDELESLMTVNMDDSMSMTTQRDTGLWTNSASFISVMTIFYDALWTLASETRSVIETMKVQERVTGTVQKVEEILTKAGWDVEIPGTLIGDSGTSHSFNAVASYSLNQNHKIAVDVLHEETFINQIAGVGLKKIDLQETIMIVSSYEIDDRAKALVRLYGLQLIGEPMSENLEKNILDLIKEMSDK